MGFTKCFPALSFSLSSVFFSLSWPLKNWIVSWLIPRATGHSLYLLYDGFIRLFSTTAKNRRKSLIRTSPWEWYRVLLVKESVSVKTAAQGNYTRTFSSDVSVLTDVVPTKQNWGFNSGHPFLREEATSRESGSDGLWGFVRRESLQGQGQAGTEGRRLMSFSSSGELTHWLIDPLTSGPRLPEHPSVWRSWWRLLFTFK